MTIKKTRYFEPKAKVWVQLPTGRYPATVIQRQSGVYRVVGGETDDEVLVKAGDVSERRA
jgi:hypothetical protein